MTNLYAWNTARTGSIAHPNVVGRAYSTLQGLVRYRYRDSLSILSGFSDSE